MCCQPSAYSRRVGGCAHRGPAPRIAATPPVPPVLGKRGAGKRGTPCPSMALTRSDAARTDSGSGVAPSARVAAIVRRFFPWVVVDLPLVWACYALALLVRGVTTDLEYAPGAAVRGPRQRHRGRLQRGVRHLPALVAVRHLAGSGAAHRLGGLRHRRASSGSTWPGRASARCRSRSCSWAASSRSAP